MTEGLLSNSAATLCQDSAGYLWIGSGDGISVFDGQTSTNYSVSNGLPSSFVNWILPDAKRPGTMWIGTNGGGVSEFHDGAFTNFKIGTTSWSERVNSLAEGTDGRIYCATDGGMYVIENGVVNQFKRGLGKGPFQEIEMEGHKLYVLGGKSKGVITVVDTRSGEVERPPDNLPDRSGVSYFSFDSADHLWVSYSDGILSEDAGGSYLHERLPSPASFVAVDKTGNVWVGTSYGLFRFNKGDFGKRAGIHLTKANGLPGSDVGSGLIDREGDLWFCTYSHGVCELTHQNSCVFRLKYSDIALNNSQGGSDGEGHIWVTGNSSLLELWRAKSGAFKCSTHPFKELRLKGVNSSLHITHGTDLWLFSASGTVRLLKIIPRPDESSNLALVKSFFLGRLFHHIAPLCFWVGNEGRIWCSLDKVGVVEFNARKGLADIHVFDQREYLPDNSVRSIFEDSKGNAWFGGYIGGLAELRRSGNVDVERLFTTENGLPDNSIRSITEDSSGNLWIGTRYGGAAVYRNGRFDQLTVKNGLISDGVWSVAFNKKFGVAFATQSGLQLLRDPGSKSRTLRTEGKRKTIYSCGITSTGLLWGANESEVYIKDLAHESRTGVPPNVSITRLLVNGDPTPVANLIRLPYYSNTLTFDFSGVSLRDGETLAYRYILRGADKKWHLSPTTHSVTYVSLKPGNYVFNVLAAKPSGLQSTRAAAIQLTIVPPLWDRWWFLASAALLVIGLIYSAIKFRLNRILEIGRVRSRLAADLHDEIGSGLTRIALLADFALGETQEAGESDGESASDRKSLLQVNNTARKIGASARALIDSMGDVIWSIDPKYDSLRDFLLYFRTYANEVVEAKGVSLEIDTGFSENVKIGPQVKRVLQLISKEAVTNALKYSCCRRIRYALSVADKSVQLIIEDDGSGFDPNKVERGNGLNNMERHARDIGGEIRIESAREMGTRISVRLPIS